MVALSMGSWQVMQPADLCCVSSVESPRPGDLSSVPAFGNPTTARSDADILPAGKNKYNAVQINAVPGKTGAIRRLENRCQRENRIAQIQNVNRTVVNPESNTRPLKMSSKPTPGIKLDTPVVITIFSVNGGRY